VKRGAARGGAVNVGRGDHWRTWLVKDGLARWRWLQRE